jgi:hypothetical protein
MGNRRLVYLEPSYQGLLDVAICSRHTDQHILQYIFQQVEVEQQFNSLVAQ